MRPVKGMKETEERMGSTHKAQSHMEPFISINLNIKA